jgi:hypothetical protein
MEKTVNQMASTGATMAAGSAVVSGRAASTNRPAASKLYYSYTIEYKDTSNSIEYKDTSNTIPRLLRHSSARVVFYYFL